MERLGRIEQSRAPSRALGKLDRRLHAFRARICEKHIVQSASHPTLQLLSQEPGKQGRLELNHRRQVEREVIRQRFFDGGMVAPEVAHGVTAEEIEVLVAAVIPEVGASRANISLVKTNCSKHARELGIHMRAMKFALAMCVVGDGRCEVEAHGSRSSSKFV